MYGGGGVYVNGQAGMFSGEIYRESEAGKSVTDLVETWGPWGYNPELAKEYLAKAYEECVVIIEDVTTSGKSIEEVYPKIKALEIQPGGIKIVGEIVSLNREERAPDSEKSALEVISEKYGFPARAIVSMSDIVDALYTNGDKKVITDEIKTQLDAYYKEWGCKK